MLNRWRLDRSGRGCLTTRTDFGVNGARSAGSPANLLNPRRAYIQGSRGTALVNGWHGLIYIAATLCVRGGFVRQRILARRSRNPILCGGGCWAVEAASLLQVYLYLNERRPQPPGRRWRQRYKSKLELYVQDGVRLRRRVLQVSRVAMYFIKYI